MNITKKMVVVGLAVVVVLLAVAGVVMSSQMHKAESCTMCHEMQPFYDSWKDTAHGEGVIEDCHTCHVPHKAEILIIMEEGMQHIKGVEASEIESEPPATPKNEYCMECHKQYPAGHEEHIAWMSEKYPEYNPEYTSGHECVICHDDHEMKVKAETCTFCHPIEG